MLTKIFKFYKEIANFIGKINTKIILTIFYFLIIPAFKLFVIFIKKDRPSQTNWKNKEEPIPNSHEHSF